MGLIESKRVLDRANTSGQATVVAAQQFAQGGGTDEPFQCIRSPVHGVPMSFVQVGRQVSPNVAIVGQHPCPEFGILPFLTLAGAIVRCLIQERGKLGKTFAESGKLVLPFVDDLGRRRHARTAPMGEAMDADPQRSGRPQEVFRASSSGRAKTLVQASPPEC